MKYKIYNFHKGGYFLDYLKFFNINCAKMLKKYGLCMDFFLSAVKNPDISEILYNMASSKSCIREKKSLKNYTIFSNVIPSGAEK